MTLQNNIYSHLLSPYPERYPFIYIDLISYINSACHHYAISKYLKETQISWQWKVIKYLQKHIHWSVFDNMIQNHTSVNPPFMCRSHLYVHVTHIYSHGQANRCPGTQQCSAIDRHCADYKIRQVFFPVSWPRQNGRLFTDDIFTCIFLNESVWISVKISLKFVLKDSINNIIALV